MVIREPWVGDAFSGLLIIGESHYGEEDKADKELTRHLITEITAGRWSNKFFTTVRRLIGGASSDEDPALFWSRVAFLNFCPGLVPDRGHRPTAAMWQSGHDAMPGLLKRITPHHILVLGAQTWDNMPPFDAEAMPLLHEGRMREVGHYRVSDDVLAPATSIPHPTGSWGFSPSHWHSFVTTFLEMPAR